VSGTDTTDVETVRRLAQKALMFIERDAATDFGSPWSFVLEVGHLALAAIAYFFLAAEFREEQLGGYPPFGFFLVGIMVQGYMTTVLVTCSQVILENRRAGTLKAMLTTRTSPLAFVGFSSIYPFFRATFDAGGYLVVGIVLGSVAVHGNAAGASLAFVLSLITFSSLGLALATLSLVARGTQAAVTALISASWLLSGGLYPPQVLPAPLQGLAPWLPATHAINALRATLLDSASLATIAPDLAALAVFALVSVPASAAIFSAGMHHARVRGTLGRV
jgi:ABC-2 type transport system permease protein